MIPFALALATALPTSDYADDDRDGLLNGWERRGFGPLKPIEHGCKPDRADFIVCLRIRPGMTPELIQPTLDRMKKFYAEMPYTNLDGSKGLNFIPIVLPPHPNDKGQGYIEFYEEAMPKEWRGLARGILVGNSPGGGGQANRPDWAGTGYNWFTMVHELGHQLGLPHSPLGSNLGSPLHGSLMNYDYSYQFDGDPERVRFSPGTFASLKLRETALEEVLPFPAAQLSFLSKRPHYFEVKGLGPKSTSVDWNRNGIHGESKVRANINDGYSVELRADLKAPKVMGAPMLVATGKRLLMVAPISPTTDITSPTAEKPATAHLFAFEGKKVVELGPLGSANVASDLSAVSDGGNLVVAHATPSGWLRCTYSLGDKPALVKKDEGAEAADPTLANTPLGLVTLLCERNSGNVVVLLADKTFETGLASTKPVGAVWNPAKKTLGIAIVEDKGTQVGRIRVVDFTLTPNSLTAGTSVTVGGEKSPGLTSNRPILLFDHDTATYKVIVKGFYKDPHQNGLNYMCRQIGTREGWWIKMLGNEWALSRSVGSAVEFGGDLVYAYRWHGGPEDNSVWVSLRSSGIEKGVITDFDEVKFIFERGLRESLNAVRNEQWPTKNWK